MVLLIDLYFPAVLDALFVLEGEEGVQCGYYGSAERTDAGELHENSVQ